MASCGKAIFNYKGYDANNLQSLDYLTDLISVDAFSGAIKINSNKPEGIYYIKLEGTLPDLISKDYLVFKIIITSKEPSLPFFMGEP